MRLSANGERRASGLAVAAAFLLTIAVLVGAERAQSQAAPPDAKAAAENAVDANSPAAILAEAHAAARQIEEAERKVSALCEIATAEAFAKLTEQARRTFAEALTTARGIKAPDPENEQDKREDALHEIAVNQIEAGFISEAIATQTEIVSPEGRWWVHYEIVERVCSFEDTKEKLAALAQIIAAEAKAPRLVAETQSPTGEGEVAKDDWIDWARSELASTQAKAEAFPKAFATAREIKDPFWKTSALTHIAAAQAEARLVEDARKSFAEALNAIHGIEAPRGKAWALRDIGVAQAQAAMKEQARGTFARAVATAQRIEDCRGELRCASSTNIGIGDSRAGILSAIAADQADAGLFDDAVSTALAIEDVHAKVSNLCGIAAAQSKAGLAERARAEFRKGTNHRAGNQRGRQPRLGSWPCRRCGGAGRTSH